MTSKSVVLAIVASATLGAQVQPSPAIPSLDGKLYRAVFASGVGVLTSGDLAAVSEPQRSRLSTFLVRRAVFKSTYRGEADSFEKARADAKRRVVERAIVSLIDAPGVERAAASFVESAPIAYEWEGLPDGPLAEAAYAEAVLKKEPSSVLAPYLYLFIAQRERAAFEAADARKDVEAMKAAAKKYRTFVQRARAVSDPIFGLVADDLDRQAWVYVKTDKHPREFNPDA